MNEAAPAVNLYAGVSPESLRSALDASKLDEQFKLEPLFTPRYARFGRSPIPYGIVTITALVAAAWAHGWATWDSSAPEPLQSSEWWVNVNSLFLPAEGLESGPYSTFRMWWALGLLVLSGAAIAVWVGRIGKNLRPEHGPFGTVLPIVAFPAWWVLPLTLGGSVDLSRSRYDVLTRYLIAFGILIAQFLLFRWPLLNRIWRAGRLPYDVASLLLWLPNLIPWMMICLANAYTYFQAQKSTTLADSAWRPTPAMLDWARWTGRFSFAAILVLLVVVSVRQHVAMAQDRTAEEAARLAA